MKKRLLSLLLVGAMAASMLVGCGGKSETADTPAANAPATEKGGTEEVAISFYTTETGKDDMFMQLIADFEAKNEGITVEYIAAGDDQLQKWMSLYASNEGPTVSLMDPINIYENQARMLEFTADNAPFLTNIEESALSTLTFDGKVYAAPMSAAGIGILYNKDVLDKAVGGEFDPTSIKTVADLEDLFEKIEATGVAASCFSGVNWSLGSHYLCQTYGTAIGDVAARVAYVDELKAGNVTLMDDAEALASGQCGTWFMGDWAWTYLAPIVSEGQQFGILPIPYNNEESRDEIS